MEDNITTIIIGNGFDINLGLPTSYTHFIQSPQFADLIGRGNRLAEYLKKKHELQNWVDIENELKRYSIEEADNNYKDDFSTLCFQLINYINNIDYNLINTSSIGYGLIESFSENPNKFVVLDFNYTQSIKHILRRKFILSEEVNKQIIKVHGEASNNNIIFGVEDDAPIKPEHVFLRKAFPRYYKAWNFNSLFSKSNQIIFFGHSLGQTDHTYFKRLIQDSCNDGNNYGMHNTYLKNQLNKSFHFFFYGDKGYHDLLQQLDELTGQHLTNFRQFNDVKFISVEEQESMMMR